METAVRREYRDAITSKFEDQMVALGAKDFDDGLRRIARFLEFFTSNVNQIRTREQLQRVLDDMPDLSRMNFLLVLGTLTFLPQLLRFSIQKLAQKIDEDLPPIPPGRPGLDVVTKQQIIAHIGRRHMSGYSLEQAKKSAAIQFEQSESTIQRAWDGRGDIGDVDFRSVVKFLEEDVAC